MYNFDPMWIEENHKLNKTCYFLIQILIPLVFVPRVKTELCIFSRCGLVFWNSTTGSITMVSFITLATQCVIHMFLC